MIPTSQHKNKLRKYQLYYHPKLMQQTTDTHKGSFRTRAA